MMSKPMKRFLIVILLVALVAVVGWEWRRRHPASQLPPGIVSGNGRIESIQVDVAAKYAGRVKAILVKEGDLVEADQVLVEMDTDELQTELARAVAKFNEAKETMNSVEAEVTKREGELTLTDQQLERAKTLIVSKNISQEEYDRRVTLQKTADSALKSEKARLRSAKQNVEVTRAEGKRVETQIADATLRSPVVGRVLYRLAEEREVLADGGKALTLLNLGEIYMEIYLPAEDAARTKIGAEARVTLDARPGYAAKANVSFVSPEAQFTPKQVETRSERDKLMFRVKLRVPPEDMLPYLERIKTGVRGVGYVRLDDSAAWPESLETPFPKP
jgi:HlyD family secretion protein